MTGVRRIGTLLLLAGFAVSTVACIGGKAEPAYAVQGVGNANHGKQLISKYDCGSCHTIPGVRGARGVVGPPLYFFARRTYIAGEAPNTPDNLVKWISDPQSIEPNTAMPNLGLTHDEARDVAAYLYTLQ